MNLSMHTFTITVIRQDPGSPPFEIVRDDGYAWDMQSATARVAESTLTAVAGTKLTIGIEVCRGPEEQELCERVARSAATDGKNLRTVARALHLDAALVDLNSANRTAWALAILKAAQDAGKDQNTILNAFALEG